MKLLLDTHIWIRQLLAPESLPRRVRTALDKPEHQLFLSAISLWETLVLARKGRIILRPNAREWVQSSLRSSPLATLPLTPTIALRSEELPGFRNPDPADRFLVATALEHELILVSEDKEIRACKLIKTIG